MTHETERAALVAQVKEAERGLSKRLVALYRCIDGVESMTTAPDHTFPDVPMTDAEAAEEAARRG